MRCYEKNYGLGNAGLKKGHLSWIWRVRLLKYKHTYIGYAKIIWNSLLNCSFRVVCLLNEIKKHLGHAHLIQQVYQSGALRESDAICKIKNLGWINFIKLWWQCKETTRDREVLLGLSQSLDPKGQGGRHGYKNLQGQSRRGQAVLPWKSSDLNWGTRRPEVPSQFGSQGDTLIFRSHFPFHCLLVDLPFGCSQLEVRGWCGLHRWAFQCGDQCLEGRA